jgi:hypothetical protein
VRKLNSERTFRGRAPKPGYFPFLAPLRIHTAAPQP